MTTDAFEWARNRLPEATDFTITPLRAEASFRSFYRLTSDRKAGPRASISHVLMVSPPDREQNAQFETLAAVFIPAGVPVPEIIAADRKRGWFLLTDLGSAELEEAYGTKHESAALAAALNTLVQLQSVSHPAIPPYTRERFTDELGIFSEWFVARLLGSEVPAPVDTAFNTLLERITGLPSCCVHRDYHCRNLLFDPSSGRFGVVDFQDALQGPVSYDLASLLHDCYHTFTDRDVDHWLDWYLEHSPLTTDRETFAIDVDYTAIQRQLKAVGIFARLRLRDGKSTHLDHILPVIEQLKLLTGRYPAFAPLADWLSGLDLDRIRDGIEELRTP